ncbi:MAG: phospholipid-binding domain-containing protein [Pelagibacteraceae bacterium]|nr:phospholipid-binding domain-containing protein [Pelagibacteraceae bacterium]|tara:strand:- start:2251 stop:2871 length:621 start_codon:yes stop_codon:yes gene_type:complete
MSFIKEFFPLKKISCLILLLPLILFSCSGTQIIGTGVTTGVATTQDEKTLGEAVNDTAISLGIKDRIFMYDAILVTKIGVDVQQGKVLLTGKVKDQSQRVEIVRLAWKQTGVTEVLNEIDLTEGLNIINYAEDKSIHAQLLGKVLVDRNIKKLKYTFEVQDKIIFIMGVTSNTEELERVFEHARSIKGVLDIIDYVDIISPELSDS